VTFRNRKTFQRVIVQSPNAVTAAKVAVLANRAVRAAFTILQHSRVVLSLLDIAAGSAGATSNEARIEEPRTGDG
jgi:hypothetical protein